MKPVGQPSASLIGSPGSRTLIRQGGLTDADRFSASACRALQRSRRGWLLRTDDGGAYLLDVDRDLAGLIGSRVVC